MFDNFLSKMNKNVLVILILASFIGLSSDLFNYRDNEEFKKKKNSRPLFLCGGSVKILTDIRLMKIFFFFPVGQEDFRRFLLLCLKIKIILYFNVCISFFIIVCSIQKTFLWLFFIRVRFILKNIENFIFAST